MEFAVCTCDTLKAAGSGYRREPSKQPVDRSAIMPVFRPSQRLIMPPEVIWLSCQVNARSQTEVDVHTCPWRPSDRHTAWGQLNT